MNKKYKFWLSMFTGLSAGVAVVPLFTTTNNISKVEQIKTESTLNGTVNEPGVDESNSSRTFQYVTMPGEQELESDTKWIDSIKESSESNTIKLFFTRDASLVFQQSMIAIQNILKNNSENETNKPFVNEIGFFIDDSIVQNVGKFDYSELRNKDNILFVSRESDFVTKAFLPINLSKTINDDSISGEIQTNEEIQTEEEEIYKTIPSENFLRKTIEHYKKKFPNQEFKFDLWIPDLSLRSLWNGRNQGFIELMPYINKIYLISDGNAQTYTFAKDYVEYIKKREKEEQAVLSDLSKIMDKNLDENERTKLFKKYNFFDFLRTDLFTIFHIDRYVDSSYYKIDKSKMYTSYIFNYDYKDMSIKLSNNMDAQREIIEGYENYFRIKDQTLDDFVYEGFENYDPRKKNIIWIGDSLIREEKHVDVHRKDEIQKLFLGLYQKYDPSEYNYFFKHHPYYSDVQQKQLTDFITGLAPDIKPIYFKNFPWELFLSWDKSQQNKKGYVSFFSSESNKEEIPQTQFIGIQYTTSVIASTYNFNIRQNNMSPDDAWKSINNKNFPIPGTFDIVTKGLPSQNFYDEQVKINKQKIQDIYDPYLALGKYSNLVENENSVYDFLVENNIDFKKEYLSVNNIDMWLKIVLPITLSVTFLTIAISVLLVANKRKNKK